MNVSGSQSHKPTNKSNITSAKISVFIVAVLLLQVRHTAITNGALEGEIMHRSGHPKLSVMAMRGGLRIVQRCHTGR